jgi:hypothetical protein
MTDTNSLKDHPFNKVLNRPIAEIVDKYVALIGEYYAFISENQNIVHKKQYPYLLARGLDTITHVFTMILFYTKNLEITYYHSQKSFYFYVEFIEQILDAQHAFLHLDSRDASIFVYKKTIYEINPEFRTDVENTYAIDDQFKTMNAYIQIYKLVPYGMVADVHKMISARIRDMATLVRVYDFLCLDTSAGNISDGISEILK